MLPSKQANWDPISPSHWAQALGLVHVPMFGAERVPPIPGNHSILLDGARASFAISCVDESMPMLADEPLGWSWSANMRHTVEIDRRNSIVLLRRWDSPTNVVKRQLPKTPAIAQELLDEMEKARSSRLPDVISRMLRVFKQIRANISPYASDPCDTVRIFNSFLMGTEHARFGRIDGLEWRQSRTVGEALSLLPESEQTNISDAAKAVLVGDLLDTFTEPDPLTHYVLEPDLFIRHAAGVLFQEAHFELEREALRQLTIPGLASWEHTKGTPKRDARFTPPSLARTIVQQALDAYGDVNTLERPLRILDPACGSGVFLQEALRELVSRKFHGSVIVHGFDNSEISCIIARFCIKQISEEINLHGIKVAYNIDQRNALEGDWQRYDIILMNPPFVNWQNMADEEKDQVRQILQALASSHVDKSMAFLWKATEHLDFGGVLGCILPAPLLSSNGGTQWREAILSKVVLVLLGRFRGYGYFPGAMVEPAFVVLKQKSFQSSQENVKVVTASEGAEDKALRLLRRGVESSREEEGAQVSYASPEMFPAANWMPHSSAQREMLTKLTLNNIPRVKDLFRVHQGIRTGDNTVFILLQSQFDALPSSEKQYFKPLAGTKTIKAGQIIKGQFVFYPYGKDGLTILTEDQLKNSAPYYYQNYLAAAKHSLLVRYGVSPEQWWTLARERSWQWEQNPKIVTKYFGEEGSFAYDQSGHYVVGQGYGWLWKQTLQHSAGEYFSCDQDQLEEGDETIDNASDALASGALPWAYLALLNSPVFIKLLAYVAPQLQGGQYNLSTRFVNDVFIPDFSDESTASHEIVEQLAKLGRAMSQGTLVASADLTNLVVRAYGFSLNDWNVVVGDRQS